MKFLYRYDVNHRLEKHRVTEKCNPDKISDPNFIKSSDWIYSCYDASDYENDFNQSELHSHFHGFATLKAARQEEISNLKSHIYDLQERLKKMEGKK